MNDSIQFIWVLKYSFHLSRFPLFWQWNSDKLKKIQTALSSEIFFAMYRPEIGPGSIAWLAKFLPLNQRCLIFTILIVWTKFCSSIQFFHPKLWTKSWKLCFSLIEVLSSAEYFDFPLFWQWNSKKWKHLSLRFSGKIFCFVALHRPGIETGSIAWEATILPLNHRCLIYTILIVWTNFCSSIHFFLRNFEQNHEKFVSF